MNANEVSKTLLANLGKTVRIQNEAHEGDSNKVGINFSGKLEDHDGGEFYVRVGEDYFAGAMGVSFRASHVKEFVTSRVCADLWIVLN